MWADRLLNNTLDRTRKVSFGEKIQPLEARSSQGKGDFDKKQKEAPGALFLGFNKTRSLGSGTLIAQAITHCVTCFVGQGRDIHPTRMDFSLHSLSTSLRLEEIFLDRHGLNPLVPPPMTTDQNNASD